MNGIFGQQWQLNIMAELLQNMILTAGMRRKLLITFRRTAQGGEERALKTSAAGASIKVQLMQWTAIRSLILTLLGDPR